jgi:aarF domain-containing kinase
MEFVEGCKINEIEELKKRFGKPQLASEILIDVFAKMIFNYGHVHCDAHPGNILVREHPTKKGKPQIVLLDHGFYCDLSEEFRLNFSNMWYAMVTMNYFKLREVSTKMGIGEYYRYLPLLFTYRTINAKKPLGGTVSKEEVTFLKGNDEVNFEKISYLL